MPKTKEKQTALVPAGEQPYPVPENWVWVRLGDVLNYEQPTAYIVDSTEYNNEFRTPVLTAGKSFILGYTNETTGICTDLPVIIFDDFTTESKYVDFPFKVKSSAMKILRSTNDIQEIFTYFYMQTVNCDNSQHRRFWISTYSNFPIPLPPLPEQHRIVQRIESLFEKLDRAKELVQSSIDSFETRKAAILHKAFTGELTAKWREENGTSFESWEERTLGDVAEYKKGPFGSSITKVMFVSKGRDTYKVYEQGNAIRKTIDYGSYYITESKFNELKGFAINPGDIIISCAGTIGEVYKLPDNCEAGVINQALMRVRIKDCIEERYFIYYFGEILKGDIVDQANGTAIKNIPPFSVMKAMQISLPTLPEQQEIVRILDSLFEKEQRARELCDVIGKIDLMKKAILARAFRGELGTNDPSEESMAGLVG